MKSTETGTSNISRRHALAITFLSFVSLLVSRKIYNAFNPEYRYTPDHLDQNLFKATADLAALSIEYSPRVISTEDREIWHDESLRSINLESGILTDNKTETRIQIGAIETALRFFPQNYWGNRNKKFQTLHILPLVQNNEADSAPYHYRYDEKDNIDVIALPIPGEKSALFPRTTYEFEEQLSHVLSAFVHMHISKNIHAIMPMLDKIGGEPIEAVYQVMKLVRGIMSGKSISQEDLSGLSLDEIYSFMDQSTGAIPGSYETFHRNTLHQNLDDIASKASQFLDQK